MSALVHVLVYRLNELGADIPPASGLCACGLCAINLGPEAFISSEFMEAELPAATPTPTCPRCRIAWDTAVEKAGGAR